MVVVVVVVIVLMGINHNNNAFPWLCKEEMRFLSTTPW